MFLIGLYGKCFFLVNPVPQHGEQRSVSPLSEAKKKLYTWREEFFAAQRDLAKLSAAAYFFSKKKKKKKKSAQNMARKKGLSFATYGVFARKMF